MLPLDFSIHSLLSKKRKINCRFGVFALPISNVFRRNAQGACLPPLEPLPNMFLSAQAREKIVIFLIQRQGRGVLEQGVDRTQLQYNWHQTGMFSNIYSCDRRPDRYPTICLFDEIGLFKIFQFLAEIGQIAKMAMVTKIAPVHLFLMLFH